MVFRWVGVSRHQRRVWLKSMGQIVVAAADKPATAFEVALDGVEGANLERQRWLLLPSPPFGQDVRQAVTAISARHVGRVCDGSPTVDGST